MGARSMLAVAAVLVVATVALMMAVSNLMSQSWVAVPLAG